MRNRAVDGWLLCLHPLTAEESHNDLVYSLVPSICYQ